MSEHADAGVARCWLGFAGFYTCSFAVLGIYMQFLPVWLHEVQGFDADDIAIILAAQTISRTVAGPFWSYCVDRTGNARRVLIWLSAGGAGAFALFAWAPTLATAWCVAFVFGCLYPPMHPIADAAAVRAASRLGFSFGRLRVMGSGSFLVIILLAGNYLQDNETRHVYGMLLVALAMTAFAAWFVPRDRLHVPQHVSERTPWWHLFRSKSFVILMISAALIQGSHATFYQQSTVYWNAHGIDKSTAAMLWGEGVLAEIVLLFYAKNTLEKLRPTTLLLLGGCGAIVRWIVIGSTTSLPWLFAINWLHAFSFAATYLGAIRAVERRVPAEQRATAQGVLGAAQAGGGMVFCGLVGGFTFKLYQGHAFYFMAGFAAIGVMLAMWLRRAR
ncbi:MAG: PPP family 3-phenylpropionic acid transporter [Planctomycetota bacterium]|jgi:PPP family 3-phenylpropionic acid transporter